MTPLPPVERFLGCLLGGAVGDALGYPVEFIGSAAEIHRRFGTSPPAELDYAQNGALISDDTQMTLFTAEGLIRGKLRWLDRGFASLSGCVHRAYQRWLITQGETPARADDGLVRTGWLWREERLCQRRAPGNTCLSALASGKEGTAENPPNDSKGCGAVMRSAPFGLVAGTREDAFLNARDCAVLTHGHPSGYLSAAYFSSLIFDVSRGAPLTSAMDRADVLLAEQPDHEETAAVIARVRELARRGRPGTQTLETIGGGWVGEEALGIAVLCALMAGDQPPQVIAETLWLSVAHAGDSDSTGSLTGNLLGAMHGIAALPPAWLEAVELRAVVERLARDLHAAFSETEDASLREYPSH